MSEADTFEGKSIYKALSDILTESKALGKTGMNTTQGFNFRGIDAVMNHLHPLFAKHHVVVLPEVINERSHERETKTGGTLIYRILTVRFHFTAPDGSSATTTVIGEGMDSGDKASNKAMAVALKYALTQMLLLPYDEVDPDSETHPPSSPKAGASHDAPPAPQSTTEKSHRASHPTAPLPDGDNVQVVIGAVDKYITKSGKNSKGKPWTRHSAVMSGEWYSTFDSDIGAVMAECHKTKRDISLTYKMDGKYRTVVDAVCCDTAEQEAERRVAEAESVRDDQGEPTPKPDDDNTPF